MSRGSGTGGWRSAVTRHHPGNDAPPRAASRRSRAATLAPVLVVAVALPIGFDSVPGAERNESVAVSQHESVAVQPAESVPAGQLDLVVRHRMERGRIIVRLAGCAFLSVPFSASGGAPAIFERPLSVPSGKHPVEVSFLDRLGRMVAQKTTEGTVAAGQSITLHVDEHSGSGDGLTLTWRTP